MFQSKHFPWYSRTANATTVDDPSHSERQMVERCGKWAGYSLILVPIAVVSRDVVAGKRPWIADRPKTATIIVLLAVFSNHPSPIFPDISEWEACGKPLRVMSSVFAAVLATHFLLALWLLRLLFRRDQDETSLTMLVFAQWVPTGIHLTPRRADALPEYSFLSSF